MLGFLVGLYVGTLLLSLIITGLQWAGVAALQHSAVADIARYTARKLLLAIPLLVGVVTLIFFLVELSPGTIVDKFITDKTTPEIRAALIAKWHLEDPAYVRYFAMMANLARLDFGVSMDQDRPVFDVIAEALPNTLILSVTTLLTMYPIGVLTGIIQGVRQNKPDDTAMSVLSLFLYSMPIFWFALVLQLVFGAKLKWVPISGMHDPVMYDFMSSSAQFRDSLIHLVLPGIGLGIAYAASPSRFMRSSLLEVVQQDYIRTARAKGLSGSAVILKHAVQNALLPMITLIGLTMPYVFGGSVITENVFAWPGMGRVILGAILAQDTPLIIACFFVYTLLVVTGSIIADIAYAIVDPRIRLD